MQKFHLKHGTFFQLFIIMSKGILHYKKTIVSGIVASCIMAISLLVIHIALSNNSKVFLVQTAPSITIIFSTIIYVSGAILVWLLIILAINSGMDSKLKDKHYFNVLHLAKFNNILFVSALIIFQYLPINDIHKISSSFVDVIYYSTVAVSSILFGAITIVVMLLHKIVINTLYLSKSKTKKTDLQKQEISNKRKRFF